MAIAQGAVDLLGMTYPWVAALIVAVAAFAGTLIAQLLQGGRERKARIETRKHEDRNRFAKDKQQLYGAFLSAADSYMEIIGRMIAGLLDGSVTASELDDRGRTEAAEQLRSVVNQIIIVGPKSVSDPSKEIFDMISKSFIGITVMVNSGQDYESTPTAESLRRTRARIRDAVVAMRADLGIDELTAAG